MTHADPYSLKNSSITFKVLSTLAVVGSVALLLWSWTFSLSVLSSHRPSDLCITLGDDLWALAHYEKRLFVLVFVVQACAYGGIFAISRMLFGRAAFRRRLKAFLLGIVAALTALNQLIWVTAPFVRFSQNTAGYVGLVSAIALIVLCLPPLFEMWFFRRWKNPRPTHIVIVGGGFAGLYTALGLDKALGYHKELQITLIDRKNYFLFPPLLPSASVGTIETRQVTYSFRRIVETTNIRYQKATVRSVDPATKTVRMHVHIEPSDTGGEPAAAEVDLPYDLLVLAPGSTNQTFNTKGAEEHALFCKELPDAMRIRNRIIDCFERAAVIRDEVIRRELLRFAVVGGGPTGIEVATEIQDLIHEVLLKRYPEIDPSWPDVTVIQSGAQILPGWPESVVKNTTEQLRDLGIKLILNNRVMEVRGNAVVLKDGPAVAARTILWCAGVQPSPLLRNCGLTLDKSGRVPVDEFLRADGHENIYVMGDSATCIDQKSERPLPPLGQVAFQQGDYLAKNLMRRLRGEAVAPFRYFNFGSLVSVGEHYAAVELLGVKLTGFIGWFVWRTLYLVKIIGFSNKVRIVIDWTLDLLIERSIAQLQDTPHGDEKKSDQPAEVAPAKN